MTTIFKENILGLKVQTPDGFKSFAGIAYMGDKPTVRVVLSNGITLECSTDHKIYVSDTEYVHAIELHADHNVMTTSGICTVVSVIATGDIEPVYDLIEVDGGHRYYTGGILSSNCEFLTADETLINAVTLLKMQGVEPLFKMGNIRWYDVIQPNKTYVVALDPSAGVGQDFSAIEVFSLPDMRQVAEWSHNRTSIPQQVKTMQGILKYIYEEMKKHRDQRTEPELYYTLENNSWGEAAIVTIDDIGEEHFPGMWLHEPKIRGQGRMRRGLNTNVRSKALACMKMKGLIESNKLSFLSKPLVRQIKFFVAKGNSFAGKSGENDDCVMAALLCVRMMQMVTTWDESLSNLMKDEFDDEGSEPMPFTMGY